MTDATDPLYQEVQGPTPRQMLKLRALGHKGLIFGLIVVGLLVVIAILAPVLAPHDPYEQSLMNRMVPPVFLGGTWEHPLGTDHLGRDYLSRLIYGARVSLLIGAVAALISGVIGTAMGVAAGYFGGKVDAVVTFLINVRLAMPVVLVALAVVAILGGSLTVVVCVLGLLLWDRFAVVMRASTLQVSRRDYVAAAQVIGASTPRILLTEIMPNIFNNLIVVITLEMAHAILLEAALSFLGLGVQPPTPSWGLMVSEGKNMMLFEPWLVLIPGAVLFLLVLAINLMGDGLRDVTAPEGRS
ncbi:Dipeptide transport system permease protein DppC (TC 3.A.1.5.2) [Tritonibacter mobilis]|uniref:ABC transporter permease n=1 Tax=Tritonibacter mobilis TaxID=379347 RepID=UPI0001B8AAFD|nr:ABC transporter permease [Tritonibacter mobilis]EEW60864.1 binding-protein-dependent transport systems inner membrane component [Ruegeria sp. TrichCH4B]MCZ4269862.1 ABC transporter permease [Rhodobacteraceae bacterium G21628-S1]MEE2811286.1 ABC transporter permease [Pseudomonadota bacterium]NKX28923.1 ABC transporter permease [Rhodobacteraceae bacterium R_SAG6]NKX36884.1 ABC transporter permease [Rhodobacteraceae bacterium R_SAG4]NKX39091.1 ABC transporter permease [Rhodobacteraceae bacter